MVDWDIDLRKEDVERLRSELEAVGIDRVPIAWSLFGELDAARARADAATAKMVAVVDILDDEERNYDPDASDMCSQQAVAVFEDIRKRIKSLDVDTMEVLRVDIIDGQALCETAIQELYHEEGVEWQSLWCNIPPEDKLFLVKWSK